MTKLRWLRREEEASFSRTLQKGIERFKKAAANATNKSFSGKDAFELYDTYGFPMDLTEVGVRAITLAAGRMHAAVRIYCC